jgi:hypothetical protein
MRGNRAAALSRSAFRLRASPVSRIGHCRAIVAPGAAAPLRGRLRRVAMVERPSSVSIYRAMSASSFGWFAPLAPWPICAPRLWPPRRCRASGASLYDRTPLSSVWERSPMATRRCRAVGCLADRRLAAVERQEPRPWPLRRCRALRASPYGRAPRSRMVTSARRRASRHASNRASALRPRAEIVHIRTTFTARLSHCRKMATVRLRKSETERQYYRPESPAILGLASNLPTLHQ